MNTDRRYLKGCALLSPLSSSGVATNYQDYGETSKLDLTFEADDITATSTCGILDQEVARATKAVRCKGTLTLMSNKLKALALQLSGSAVEVTDTAAVYTNEAFPSGVAAGETRPIPGGRTHLSAFVLKDSTPVTPLVPTVGTHYTVDLDAGLVFFTSLGAFVQPFMSNGTQKANIDAVGIMTALNQELALRFKGINILNDSKYEIMDLWKIRFDPASTWNIKGDGDTDSPAELAFTAMALATAPITNLGQFGRYVGDSLNA